MGRDSDKDMPKLKYIVPAGQQDPNISLLPEYTAGRLLSVDISKQICIKSNFPSWLTQGQTGAFRAFRAIWNHQ